MAFKWLYITPTLDIFQFSGCETHFQIFTKLQNPGIGGAVTRNDLVPFEVALRKTHLDVLHAVDSTQVSKLENDKLSKKIYLLCQMTSETTPSNKIFS